MYISHRSTPGSSNSFRFFFTSAGPRKKPRALLEQWEAGPGSQPTRSE